MHLEIYIMAVLTTFLNVVQKSGSGAERYSDLGEFLKSISISFLQLKQFWHDHSFLLESFWESVRASLFLEIFMFFLRQRLLLVLVL